MSATTPPSEAALAALRGAVLRTADRLWRELPWRATRDPWHVLVSEVMLQQTQAVRVVEPYRRFLDRFPTPAACAEAGTAAVVRAWSGLGYNRRAVALQRSATWICTRHDGSVPADLESLLAMPGIGPYTARAVLAFAYGAPVGVVDTNVARLVARAVAGRRVGRAEAQALADALVPPGAAWRFNQAMFDVGARCCHARLPDCGNCPLRLRCRWAAAGRPDPDPASGARRPAAPFAGSDRQGRGRLVDALRSGPVALSELGTRAGWPDAPDRASRVAATLVADGIAVWEGTTLVLA